jgi:hypothetical protein
MLEPAGEGEGKSVVAGWATAALEEKKIRFFFLGLGLFFFFFFVKNAPLWF